MKKEYKVKIRSIKAWNSIQCRYDYTNASEALNYIVDIIASEKDFGLIVKKGRKDKLILGFYCDVETYYYIKMRFICKMGKHFEWIDDNHPFSLQKSTTT